MSRPDIERLRLIVSYDPTTGLFKWLPRPPGSLYCEEHRLSWNARYAGKPSLAVSSCKGYLKGCIEGRWVFAHHVAFALSYGRWPERIDHINGDGCDNRLCNLRECTAAQNSRNSRTVAKSGYKGVFPNGARWMARIYAGKLYYLGTFDTPEEAARAYDEAARTHHGDFAALNFPRNGEQSALRRAA